MFVDSVDIQVEAGSGGNGCVSFRREKFVPLGGPDGGDGGRGGSVFLRASNDLNTLVNFKYRPIHRAQRGSHGEGSNRTGKSGKDLYLDVPTGTIVFSKHESELPGGENTLLQLVDLSETGQVWQAAAGGLGGRGNQRFSSATNRAPRRFEKGHFGEIFALRLQLKLLADVGLVGYPNVGKSTLTSRLSAARPKIADYPFTTLTPHLGVVRIDDERDFVIADVPGLIEGAHEGQGLGHQFLSHLERTKVLVHMIDVTSATGREPTEDFQMIQVELKEFASENSSLKPLDGDSSPLMQKRQLVVATKIDALDEPRRLEQLRDALKITGLPLYEISAVTGEGLSQLLEGIWAALRQHDDDSANATAPLKLQTFE
jgi:GTP-binding protein